MCTCLCCLWNPNDEGHRRLTYTTSLHRRVGLLSCPGKGRGMGNCTLGLRTGLVGSVAEGPGERGSTVWCGSTVRYSMYMQYAQTVRHVQYVRYVLYSMYSMYTMYSMYNMYTMFSIYRSYCMYTNYNMYTMYCTVWTVCTI